MSRRRILMVLDHRFPPDVRVENEAVSLVRAGYDVTVMAIAPDDRPQLDEHLGVHVLRVRIPKSIRNKMRGLAGTVPAYTAFLSRCIRSAYRRAPFDYLHIHDLYLLGGGLRAGHLLGLPVVADLHENWVEALQRYAWSTRPPGRWLVSIPRWRKLEKRWLSQAARVIVVIDEAKRRNVRIGVRPEKITVLPNTLNVDAYDADPWDESVLKDYRFPFTVVYAGGFDLHRGIETLIRAMGRLIDHVPNAHLVLVGDGRNRSELSELTHTLGLAERVHFVGWQPQWRVKSFVAASQVGVIPHLKTAHTDATIPHKLFQYMYLEKPVVASNCVPLQRIVDETECGLVFDSGDHIDLAEKLVLLATAPKLMAKFGSNGRSAVIRKYNWNVTANELSRLYESLETES